MKREMNRDDRKQDKPDGISRRSFIKGAGAVAAAVGLVRVHSASADEKMLPAGVVEKLGPEATSIQLSINGRATTLEVEPRVTLLRALREHLGLTGTKLVCDRGACGACTVHLDGKPVTSCMMLAVDARGHQITTIEGLGNPSNMHPVQAAFVEADAQQCGFCTPGMVMSVAAALNRNPAATVDEIKHATAGNTCRCGTYPHVFEAALKAAKPARVARLTRTTRDA
jgi:xanthine dehydrogenase YagT iron-sulfur-binding subunit